MRGMNSMRFALMALLALTSASQAEDPIPWGDDLAKAFKQASAERKLVLVHFYADACPPCRTVEAKVFPQPEVVQSIGRNYVPVKINVDKTPQIAAHYNVRGWPTDVFLTSAGQEIHRDVTKQVAADYVTLLDQLAIQAGVGSARQAAVQNREAQFEPPTYGDGTQPPAPVYPAQVRNQYVDNRYMANQYPAQGYLSQNPAPSAQQECGLYGPQDFQTPTGYSNPEVRPPAAPQQSAAQPAATQRTNWQDPIIDITAPQQPIINQYVPVRQAPPLAIEGYCPVSICPSGSNQEGKWVKGNPRFGAVHRGRTYLFASQEAQRRFLTDPDAYSPALSGADPVIFAERGELVEGNRKFGISVPLGKGRVQMFFFASEENLIRFGKASQQYALVAHQAMLRSETGTKLR